MNPLKAENHNFLSLAIGVNGITHLCTGGNLI